MRWLENRRYVVIVIVLGALFAGCGATAIEAVPPSLIGTWQGECEMNLPVTFNPTQLPENVARTQQAVDATIIINGDASVEGAVGEALLTESVLKRNRASWVED